MKTTLAFLAGAASILLLEGTFLAGVYATTRVNSAKNDALDNLKDQDIIEMVREQIKKRGS